MRDTTMENRNNKIAFVYADERGSNGSPILGHTVPLKHIDPTAGQYACDWYVHATGEHGTADSADEALNLVRTKAPSNE